MKNYMYGENIFHMELKIGYKSFTILPLQTCMLGLKIVFEVQYIFLSFNVALEGP